MCVLYKTFNNTTKQFITYIAVAWNLLTNIELNMSTSISLLKIRKSSDLSGSFSCGFFFISLAIVTGKLSLEIAQVVQKPDRRKSDNAQCYKRPFW